MFRSGIAAMIVAAGLLTVGCAKDSMDGKSSSMKDACPMCAGHQTATADGKCPKCNMAVKAMNESGDACSHCPGVQTVTADGVCSGCKMKVKPM